MADPRIRRLMAERYGITDPELIVFDPWSLHGTPDDFKGRRIMQARGGSMSQSGLGAVVPMHVLMRSVCVCVFWGAASSGCRSMEERGRVACGRRNAAMAVTVFAPSKRPACPFAPPAGIPLCTRLPGG